ncbi:MAG: NADP-dependent oxidoreductase [Anaerolineae bacterium]|nr:NADP-dependent oxidoreductase [Anaerolineae bacterium]
MQAARIHQYGDSNVVQIESIPVPQPKHDEVLVRVRAAGLNPVDWAIRQGYLQAVTSLPLTLGWDLAGEIVEVGSGISDLKVGDEVYAMIQLRGGAFAEYVILKRNEVAKKPATFNFVQAASVPAGALTAWQVLFETANVQAGQKVLIHAAAGGVGAFAVQLAKERQAFVIGTASAANEQYVRELCADQFIDYQTTRFEDVVKDVDVVLDTVGNDTLERSYGVVKKGGIVVSIAGRPTQGAGGPYGIRVLRIEVEPSGEQLTKIAALIDAGKLKTLVSQVFPFADVRQAIEASHAGHGRGKIVVEI